MRHIKSISRPREAQIDVGVFFDFLDALKLVSLDLLLAAKRLVITLFV